MTPEQLKQIITIANKGGYTSFLAEKLNVYNHPSRGILILSDNGSYAWHINEILFCPKFGEGYWEGEEVCSICGSLEWTGDGLCDGFECDGELRDVIPAFKYHQSKLGGMSVEERNAYMVRDLSHRLHR